MAGVCFSSELCSGMTGRDAGQLRRQQRTSLVLMVSQCVLAVLLVSRPSGSSSELVIRAVYVTALVLALGQTGWHWYRGRRRAADLRACDWKRCERCFFDLRGLSDAGKCPECGEDYMIWKVRRNWRELYDPPRKKP